MYTNYSQPGTYVYTEEPPPDASYYAQNQQYEYQNVPAHAGPLGTPFGAGTTYTDGYFPEHDVNTYSHEPATFQQTVDMGGAYYFNDYTAVGSNFTPEVATEPYPNFVIPSSTPTPATTTYAVYEPTILEPIILEQTQYYALAAPQQDAFYAQQYVAASGTAPYQYPSAYNNLSPAPHTVGTYHYPVQSQSQQPPLSYSIASAQLPPTSTLNSPLPVINSPARTLQHTYVPSQPQRSHSYPAQHIICLRSPSPIASTSSRALNYEVARTPTPQLVDSRLQQAPTNDYNNEHGQQQRGAPSYAWQMPSPPPARHSRISPPTRHSHISPPPSTVPNESIAIPLSLPMGGPGYQVAYMRSGTASTTTSSTAAAATTTAQTTIEPALQIDLVDTDSPNAILGNVELAATTAPNVIDARRLGLACLFCRGRKIACGPPPHRGTDSCNQCARRNIPCEFPKESRRGQRKGSRKKSKDRDSLSSSSDGEYHPKPSSSTLRKKRQARPSSGEGKRLRSH